MAKRDGYLVLYFSAPSGGRPKRHRPSARSLPREHPSADEFPFATAGSGDPALHRSSSPVHAQPPQLMKTHYRLRQLLSFLALASASFAQVDPHTQHFIDLRAKIVDPANGYFSRDGVPYHSAETLICEAPDYGHETTSEAYSYWLWLEAMNGRVTGDWTALNNAWSKMEQLAIPTQDQQPTAGSYNGTSVKATYAPEFELPDYYPAPLDSTVPVGNDPISPDLTATYGPYVYGMHWLFDCDNFYGYGKKSDGISTPSYINTFQRGPQESVWETVPQPSWESFRWGSSDGTGFLKLFVKEASTPAAQWRYTNAPDADARAVQAIYWAVKFAQERGQNPSSLLPVAKASKMGDFVRLAFCDKYFRPLGVQNRTSPGGTGYDSVHYLLSWYYAWGGPLTNQGWAWRIGSSHCHFGYQNPVAALALSDSTSLLRATSANGARDWATSLGRQLEFYQWLQSAEGAIAGGATNSWNGRYDPYPSGTPTFYGMGYQANPVYLDPGSNTWFGFQAWSVERLAEYYYLTNNARAKAILDKWVPWAKSVTHLLSDGTFEIPSEISWTGAPVTWNPTTPAANTNLHVTVVSYGKDLGIAASLAKTLTYYAAGTQKYATLDTASRDLAAQILDRMWTNYYEPTGKGVAVAEDRGDYKRFFEQTVFIPTGWTGAMANGDPIAPGVKFLDIRSKYRSDPDFPALQQAYNSGTTYRKAYHRFWAQAEIALANAEYGRLFGTTSSNTLTASPTSLSFTSASGSGTVTVTSNVTWTASANQTWITLTPTSGANNGTVTVNVTANTGTTARSGTVTLSGGGLTQTVAISQAAPSTASLAVSPTSLSFTSASGSSNVTITSNVSWTASANQTWITVSPVSGSNNASLLVSVAANTGTAARSGTVTVAGGGITRTVTVSQATPSTASLTVSPTALSLAATASSSSVAVTANVSWTASSNQTWLTVSPTSGANNGTLTVSATANTGAASRSGTIAVTGGGITRTVSVTQAAPSSTTPCSNPTTITVPFAKDGAGDFCWVISANIGYINSWNMRTVEVNGVALTNQWVAGGSLPPRINGNYYIHYVGDYAWSHFEAGQ